MARNGTSKATGMREKTFYTPPDLHRFCREFVMRELNGNDDLDIAVWVEESTTDVIANNGQALYALQQREAKRRALVSVDGAAVNLNGIPFKGMDRWGRRMLEFVGHAFKELNGVEIDEVKKFKAGEYAGSATSATSAPEEATDAPSAS